jgi:hypothetical protein
MPIFPMIDSLRQGMGYLPTDVEMARKRSTRMGEYEGRERNRPEDIWPALAPAIQALRKMRPDMTDQQLVEKFTQLEDQIKTNLPKDVTRGEVDVEVFGRRPNILQRVLAPALEQSGINPISRGLGLPQLLPKEAAEQADTIGGLAPIAGRVLGDIPLVMATGGLGKAVGMGRPLLTDLIAGGAFGAASPMLQGETPTLGGVAGNAAAFGGLGAIGRRVFGTGAAAAIEPTAAELSERVVPGMQMQRALPAALQPKAIAQGSLPMGPSPLMDATAPFGMPGSTATQPKMLGEGITDEIRSLVAKSTSGKPADRIDLLRAKRELGDAGLLPSMKPAEIVEEATIRVRDALPQLGAVRSDIMDIAQSLAQGPRALVAGSPPRALTSAGIRLGPSPLTSMTGPFESQASTTVLPKALPPTSMGVRLGPSTRGISGPFETGASRLELPRALTEGTPGANLPRLSELPTPTAPKTFATEAERDAEMIRYFRSGGEHHGEVTLGMGFDPFQAVKDLKSAWQHWMTPATEETKALLRSNARDTWGATIRLPSVIFKKAGEAGQKFWGTIEGVRDAHDFDFIKYRNILHDAVKPIIRSDKKLQEMVVALNSAEGYSAATPEIRAIADKVRTQYLDEGWRIATANAKKQGQEAPGYIKDYFTHVLDRTDTYTYLKDEIAQATKAGDENRLSALRELMKNFVTHKGRAYMSDRELGEAGKQILGELFNPRPVKEAAMGALESRTANLETWIKKDPLAILEGYMNGVLRKAHLDPQLKALSEQAALMTPNMRSRAISLIRDMSGMQHPSVIKYQAMMEKAGLGLDKLLGGKTDPAYFATTVSLENLSRFVRQAEYMRTLYGNVGGAMVNLTQIPLMTFPLLAQQYGPAKAAKAVMNAMMEAFQPRGHALAREMGAFRTRSAAGLEGQPQLLERLPELLDLFGMTETKINRPISGIAKYMLEREGGREHEAAVREGIKFIRQTQFSVDPTTIPEAFRGPVGRMGYQFQSFKQQGLNFFLQSLDKKGKAYFAAMLAAVGGPTAMPFIGGPLRDLVTEAGYPGAVSGIPGMIANVDLGRRINPVDNITGENPAEIAGRTMQSSLGPVVGGALGLLSALQRAAKYGPAVYNGQLDASTAMRAVLEPALRELEPVALQRIAAGTEVAKTGELRAGQPSGVAWAANQLGVKPSWYPERFGGYQKIGKAGEQIQGLSTGLGIPTLERTLLERVQAKAQKLKDINTIQRDRIIEGYMYFKQSNDNSALVEAMQAAPGVDLRAILKQAEMDPMTRMQGMTPKRMRGQLPTLPILNYKIGG